MTNTTEMDTRIRILQTLLTTPHGDLASLQPIHAQAFAEDGYFYGRLASWIVKRSTVRDAQVLAIAHMLASPLALYRSAGWAHLQELPLFMVAQVVRYSKETLQKATRPLVNAVTFYLHALEADHGAFDNAAVRSRQELLYLYATLHIKAGHRAHQMLFEGVPITGSKRDVMRQLASETDPAEQARLIVQYKIPYTSAVGALKGGMNKPVLIALLEISTPTEVSRRLKSLTKRGAMEDEDIAVLIKEKIAKLASGKKVNTQQLTRVAQAMGEIGQNDLQLAVQEARDTRVKTTDARLAGAVLLAVDRSGSMDMALRIAAQTVAPVLAAACDDLTVEAFNSASGAIVAQGTTQTAWERAFAGVTATGGTAIGAPLAKMQRNGKRIDHIVLISDARDNAAPRFETAYAAYARAMNVQPQVSVIGVIGNEGFGTAIVDQWKAAGIPVTVWMWGAQGQDHFSIGNLTQLIAQPSYIELVEMILDAPLPSKEQYLEQHAAKVLDKAAKRERKRATKVSA